MGKRANRERARAGLLFRDGHLVPAEQIEKQKAERAEARRKAEADRRRFGMGRERPCLEKAVHDIATLTTERNIWKAKVDAFYQEKLVRQQDIRQVR